MKHMKAKPICLLLLLSLLLTACVGTWTRIDDTTVNYQDPHYRVSLPVGWLRITSDDSLILSKDGILVQTISVQYKEHAKAFEKIRKVSTPGMLPSELAQLSIAEFQSSQDDSLPSLEVISNKPVEMGGIMGFEVQLIYKTDTGLRMGMLMRGVVDDDGYYLVKYNAPMLHYFERDRSVYETLSESLRL
jgi:hypothetical protein